MHRQWLAVGVSLTCALAVGVAQQAPAPTPPANPSFRSGISYIELDASVLDRNRNPVRGLTAGDFTVLEDGQPQKILSFTEVNVPDPAPPPVAWMRDVTPDVQANDAPMDGRLVVILLDDTQSPTPSARAEANRTKEVARMFIDRLGPADRAAVLFTRLRGSQDFTSDHAKLQTALNAFVPFQAPGADEDPDSLLASIDRLQGIVTSLAALPGRRKALFYFGVGVRMPHPEVDPKKYRAYNALIQIFRDAQKSNVNIYPIDPSGLGGPGDFDASRSGLNSSSSSVNAATEFYQTVAENTGGLAVVNQNDFATVVPRILRENGSYYLLGYESPNLIPDGRRRAINVKVNRPNVTVRARSGYYGAKTEATPKTVLADPNALPPALETVATALMQNSAVRMQLSTATFAIPQQPGAAVAITLGVRPDAVADRTQIDDVEMLAEAFTPTGVKAAFSRQPFRIGAGVTQYELLTRLVLKPGRYQLRVSTLSKLRGKAGSVFTDLDVPDFSKPLSLSGVIVHAEPGLAAPPNASVAALVPDAPTTVRDFASDQQVTTFLRVYQGGSGQLASVPLSVRIRDVRNSVVFDAPQMLNADQFAPTRAADYRLNLPLATLAPGPYLLTIEGQLKKETLRRDVRFQVHANPAAAPTAPNVSGNSAASPRTEAQRALDQVLARLAAYLTEYADQYSSTIATERYRQTYGSDLRLSQVRVLEADFGIVRLPGASQWLGLRDVTRVDGRPSADREGRLARLFRNPSADGMKQVDAIIEESTRFNIGPVLRTMNNPAIVLEALDARNQTRFTFSKSGEETLDGVRVWALRFTEHARPTFIRTFNGEDEPLAGRAWVDPIAGRPLRVELAVTARSPGLPYLATVNVTFREDPQLHLWVPATMTERYTLGSRVVASGDARYTDYRRFGVETNEELAK